MKAMKYKNTLQKGSVRYIVFKEAGQWYAVGLEFNIVEFGNDPREVLLSLFEGIQGYLSAARKVKARPYILNQKSDPEYEQLWKALEAGNKESVSNKLQVATFGRQAL